ASANTSARSYRSNKSALSRSISQNYRLTTRPLINWGGLMFAREGYPYIIGAALVAAVAFTLALRLRSWPLWLAATPVTILALSMTWFFRDPGMGDNGLNTALVAELAIT